MFSQDTPGLVWGRAVCPQARGARCAGHPPPQRGSPAPRASPSPRTSIFPVFGASPGLNVPLCHLDWAQRKFCLPVLSCPLCSERDTGHPLPQRARLHVLMAVTALKCGSCLKHRGAHLHTGDSFTPTQEGSGPREQLPPAEAAAGGHQSSPGGQTRAATESRSRRASPPSPHEQDLVRVRNVFVT